MPPTCSHGDCSKRANWEQGSRTRFFCAGDAKEGMVNLQKNKKCAHPGCTKQLSFGIAGSMKREFCAGHATEGMIYLQSKKCAHQGCNKSPSFGIAGSTKREFCAGHAPSTLTPKRPPTTWCFRRSTRTKIISRRKYAPLTPLSTLTPKLFFTTWCSAGVHQLRRKTIQTYKSAGNIYERHTTGLY